MRLNVQLFGSEFPRKVKIWGLELFLCFHKINISQSAPSDVIILISYFSLPFIYLQGNAERVRR